MPSAPMIPAHEQEHIDRTAQSLSTLSESAQRRWERSLKHVRAARVYDAFLELNEVLKVEGVTPVVRTHVQLQAVRCLRDAPVERIKTELSLIEPQDAYQTVVLDYRLGWLMRHRLASLAAAIQYFERVQEEARRINTRPWEIAALLQKGAAFIAQGEHEASIEVFTRVYNLSRRNGLIEYIPKSLLSKGYAKIQLGRLHKGEEHMQKAYELACRNELRPEQGLALHRLGQVYHYDLKFFGLAIEYYEQARAVFDEVPIWPSVIEHIERDQEACHRELRQLDIAKILGPIPMTRLRQEYLTSLVNGFVGIPGIDNRTQLGERIGLTRQAIHRNITS